MLEIVPVPVLTRQLCLAGPRSGVGGDGGGRSVGRRSRARGGRAARLAASARSGTPTGIPTIPAATTPSARRPAAPITGPAEAEKVSRMDRIVAGGDRARIGEVEAELIDIPAHTAGHVAFHLPAAQAAFVGDTLFAMGCGRLFEGDAAADVPEPPAPRRFAGRDPNLLRPRIYARQRPLRAHRRARQSGRSSAGSRRWRRPASAARSRCRRRSRSSARPIRSCAPIRSRNLPSGGGARIVSPDECV